MITFSIIIATSGRPSALGETLRSLAGIRVPVRWTGELILVENGSQEGAERLVHTFPSESQLAVKYRFEATRGKSRALNLALEQARGDVLIFSDDDVRFPDNWIEGISEAIVGGRADAVAGGVQLAPHLLRPWMNHTHRAWLANTADYLSPIEPSEMCGANMAVSRRVFSQIGGFDTELGPGITGGGEESLLSWQLKRAGFKLESALNLQVEHHLSPDRLRYSHWARAAHLKGRTRAYLMHHWFHQELKYPSFKQLYYRAKLSLRKPFFLRRNPDEEGMAPWEMSYRESLSLCSHYLKECHRPRNYNSHGQPLHTSSRQSLST